MPFKVFRWCFSKTFHRKKFFNLAEVSCFQIQMKLHMTGTCGTLRDAYQAGYSVLLKPLWLQKKPEKTGSMRESIWAADFLQDRQCQMFFHMWGVWISLSSLEKLSFSASKQLAIRLQANPHGPLEFVTNKGIGWDFERRFFFRIFFWGQSSGWLKWWVWVGGFELGAGHCNNMQ